MASMLRTGRATWVSNDCGGASVMAIGVPLSGRSSGLGGEEDVGGRNGARDRGGWEAGGGQPGGDGAEGERGTAGVVGQHGRAEQQRLGRPPVILVDQVLGDHEAAAGAKGGRRPDDQRGGGGGALGPGQGPQQRGGEKPGPA